MQRSVGYNAGSTGNYILSGSSAVTAAAEYIGSSGIGTFSQSGGTNKATSALYLSYGTSGAGSYNLAGAGILTAATENVGYSNSGTFSQSGGTNNTTGALYLGNNAGAAGSYSLSGPGYLSAVAEYIGNSGSGSFVQTGGSNATTTLNIGNNGLYQFRGGTLQINSAFVNHGIFNASGGTGTLIFASGEIADLSQSTFVNSGSLSLIVGANSLLILPAGYNTATAFANYTNLGLVHNAGAPWTLAAGKSLLATGSIADFVNCQGSIAATGGSINLNGGLMVSGTGNVNLGGGGTLTSDAASNIASGSLSASTEYVGYANAGSFNQTAGSNNAAGTLYVGYGAGSNGSYILNTSSSLSAGIEQIGYSGSGAFTQSGGSNHLTGQLYLGYSSGAHGSYSLSGTSQLSAASEYVGNSGSGSFNQTGGSNSVNYLSIGSHGQYQFSGGTLQVGSFSNQGVFSLQGGSGLLSLGGSQLFDLSHASIVNASSTSLTLGTNSLLILPTGINAATLFNTVNNSGTIYSLGSLLTILPGRGVSVVQEINDFVNCQGTLSGVSGLLNLNNGLVVSGTGIANLGNGSLSVNDSLSGISGGSLTASNEYINATGTGSFTQSGGTNNSGGRLFVGNNGNASYAMSGPAFLFAQTEYIGNTGVGTFNQSGGTNNLNGTSNIGQVINGQLIVGAQTGGGAGVYNLSGSGLLTSNYEYIGQLYGSVGQSGTFNQSGGTNNLGAFGFLFIGSTLGTSVYNLSGSSALVAYAENIVGPSPASFIQTGGLNTVSQLVVSGSNRYQLSGGTLQFNGSGFGGQAIFDATASVGSLSVLGSAIVDLSQATLVNTGSMSLSIGPNSLLLLPAGFNPVSSLGSYSNLGLVHNIGTPLPIAAGQAFAGSGTITDFVNCQGAIMAQNGFINLNGGVAISSPGSVNLGLSGVLTSDAASTIASSLMTASAEYVGFSSSGSLVQTGGANYINYVSNFGSGVLCLGYNASASGSYSLGGNGLLSAFAEFVGVAGSGTFMQSGGSNSVVYLNIGPHGLYQYNGGTLQIVGGGFTNQGIFDAMSSAVTLSITGSGIVDLSTGTLQNAGSMSLSLGPNTLLILPAGLNPTTVVGSYVNAGITHTAGTPLNILPGQTVSGIASISDFVNCQGTMLAVTNGTINLNGGVNLSGAGIVKLGSGSYYTDESASGMSGGALTAAADYVGYSGIGTFTQTGGTNVVSASFNTGSLYVGYNPSASGTYLLSGTGLVSDSNEYVGYAGSGTFTQSGGTNSIGNSIYLGSNIGASGNYNLSGSGKLTAYYMYVGYSGSGSFAQTGGTNSAFFDVFLGNSVGSYGVYNLSGSGSLNGGGEYVGYSGTGAFIQSGGTNTNSPLYVGLYNGSTGSYSLSGSGLLSGFSEYIAYGGSGQFSQSGGTNRVSNGLYLGYSASSSGIYNLSATAVLAATNEYVGYSGSSAFNQSGGTNTVSGLLQIGTSGSYNFTSGNLLVPGIASSGSFNFGGGTLRSTAAFSTAMPVVLTGSGGATIDNGGYGISLSGPISGPGSLTTIGSGLLTLTGTNSFQGGIQALSGTLVLDGASALLPGSSLTIGENASPGSIFSAVVQGGIVLAAPAAVPEPGTIALLAAALGLWVTTACRRSQGYVRL